MAKIKGLPVIIRSAGERTFCLCYESVLKYIPKNMIHVVNKAPFTEAMMESLRITKKFRDKWYLQIDADVVLNDNWVDVIVPYKKEVVINDNVYEVDFDVYDRFIGQSQLGVYLCNKEFDEARLACLNKTKDMTKPEGSIRHFMEADFDAKFIYEEQIVGYHGFMQYKSDIHNRWALRACRNKDYSERFGLFKDYMDYTDGIKGKDMRIAKAGWNYGLEHQNDFQSFMDFTKKIKAESLGYMEYLPLKIKLVGFYNEIREYMGTVTSEKK